MEVSGLFVCDCVLQAGAQSLCACHGGLRNCVKLHHLISPLCVCVFCVFVEPDFVGSALVRESTGSKDGDDDKIYFFFSERALELDCDTELTVARVARVCKVKISADSISTSSPGGPPGAVHQRRKRRLKPLSASKLL